MKLVVVGPKPLAEFSGTARPFVYKKHVAAVAATCFEFIQQGAAR